MADASVGLLGKTLLICVSFSAMSTQASALTLFHQASTIIKNTLGDGGHFSTDFVLARLRPLSHYHVKRLLRQQFFPMGIVFLLNVIE
jgi:hypothetical protein